MGPGRIVLTILQSGCRRHSTRLLWLSYSYRDQRVPSRSTPDLFHFTYVGTLVPPYMKRLPKSLHPVFLRKFSGGCHCLSLAEVLDPQLEDLNSRRESLEDTKYKTSIAILLPLGSSQIPSALLQDSDVFFVLISEPFSGEKN